MLESHASEINKAKPPLIPPSHKPGTDSMPHGVSLSLNRDREPCSCPVSAVLQQPRPSGPH